jgi:hypothetical protein
VREEYQNCNSELRNIIDSKNTEINKLNSQYKETSEGLKKDKTELMEVLTKDQYNTSLYSKENEQLRQAKADFEQERVTFYEDYRGLEAENERVFGENKELRTKVKKLEHILYGRK